jgi:hypothetical protein
MPPVVTQVAEVIGAAAAAWFGQYWLSAALLAAAAGSYIVASMAKIPGFDSGIAGRTQILRTATAPHRVVYGKCCISGPLVAAFSCGTNNLYVYLVIALTSHEVAGIDDVYLGDTLSTDIKFATPDGVNLIPISESHTIAVDGTIRLDSPPFDNRNAVYIDNIPTSDYTIVGRTVYFDPIHAGSTGMVNHYKSFVTIAKYLGTPGQTADPDLIADAVDRADNHIWTAAHTLSGRSYLVVRLEYNSTIFAAGLPNIKAVVRGVCDIYDPRYPEADPAWSDNAALCVRDYLVKTYGIDVDSADINDANFIAAANICDEPVPVRIGTGAAYTTDGSYYPTGTVGINLITGTGTIIAGDMVIITIDDAWYVIDGVNTHFPASANSYVVETSLSSGYLVLAGNGLIAAIPPTACTIAVHNANQESRYTCNGSFTLDQKPVDIMKKMLTACAGRLVWSQGTYSLFPAAYSYPVGPGLSETDLRDDISVVPAPSRQQRFNTVRGTFVSPDQYWQQVDFPFQQNANQYAADESFEICQTLQLDYTISATMAQRLAAIFLNQNLRGITVTFPAKLTAFPYQPGDVLNLSIDQLSWDEKGFRVADWKLSENGGVDLVLREEDSTIYGWTLSDEEPYSPPSKPYVTPYVVPIPNVTNFYVSQGIDTLTFTWDAVSWPTVVSYEIRYRPHGNNTWIGATFLTTKAGTATTCAKIASGDYTFLICAFDALGNYSAVPAMVDLTVITYVFPGGQLSYLAPALNVPLVVGWNPADMNAWLTLTGGNRIATSMNEGNQGAARANISVSVGKWWWKVTIGGSAVDSICIGIATSSDPLDNNVYLGYGAYAWAYMSNDGTIRHNNGATVYGTALHVGDSLGVALDMDDGTLAFYKNDVPLGVAVTGLSGLMFPCISIIGNPSEGVATVDFNDTPPSALVSAGYKNLQILGVSASTGVILELDSIGVNLTVDLVTANPVTVSATATTP